MLAAVLAAGTLWAGGSGLNVIVVVNQNSTNSVQLGNDYCEQRGVPPQNVLRLTGWTGGAVEWSRANFESLLRNPLLAMIAGRGLTNQATYVLLSMDIPYRIVDSGSYNSTSRRHVATNSTGSNRRTVSTSKATNGSTYRFCNVFAKPCA